jgi:hypothetical protein
MKATNSSRPLFPCAASIDPDTAKQAVAAVALPGCEDGVSPATAFQTAPAALDLDDATAAYALTVNEDY